MADPIETKTNTDPFALPKFPTAFTQEDLVRKTELEKQRKTMDSIYKQQFVADKWANTNPVEKTVRNNLPSWLNKPMQVLTPGNTGWDFGFTPEQFNQQLKDVEEEYMELSRKQKVVSLLPDIQAGIMVTALQGSPILSTEELKSTFPELNNDFTDEEISFLAKMAMATAQASPESLLNGEAFKDISDDELEEMLRDPNIDSRFVLTSVGFNRNLDIISQALREAYPSEAAKAESAEEITALLTNYYTQQAIDMGLMVDGGKLDKATLQKVHEKIASEAGELITITDNSTGIMSTASLKADGLVYDEHDEVIGAYDEESKSLVPVDINNKPLLSDESKQEYANSIWESFFGGANSLVYSTKQGAGNILPRFFVQLLKNTTSGTTNIEVPETSSKFTPMASTTSMPSAEDIKNAKPDEVQPGKPISNKPEIKSPLDNWANRTVKDLEIKYIQAEEIQKLWLDEHPEFVPSPKDTGNPLEDSSLWSNPMWWSNTIFNTMPTVITAMSVGVGVTAATGNPLIGSIAGAVILTPSQISSLYDDLVANGATPEQATNLSVPVGTLMGSIEVIPELVVLKAVKPMIMQIFKKNLQKELTKEISKSMIAKGIIKTIGNVEISETLEEVTQQAMQNATVRTVNENRGLFENLGDTAIQTAIATLPTAIFGGGGHYMGMRNNLSSSTKAKVDKIVDKLVEKGLSQDHAEAVAVSELASTETGRAEIKEALNKDTIESKPMPEAIKKLGEDLIVLNKDISYLEKRISLESAKVEAGTGDSDLENQMRIELTELYTERKSAMTQIKNLMVETNYRVKSKTTTPTDLSSTWDIMDSEEKLNLAVKAGIAKTTAKTKWVDLTDRQKELLGYKDTKVSSPIVESTPSIEVQSIRKIGAYEVTEDKDGRTIICG